MLVVGMDVANAASEIGDASPFASYVPLDKSLSGQFTVVGSGVMSKMLRLLEESYEAMYPDMDLNLSAPSSAAVPTGLIKGTIAVGAMSRPMYPSEKQAFLEKHGFPIQEFQIARDALLIVVNRTNPLPGITMAQLDGIYSESRLRGGEKIETWSDLGLAGEWTSQPVKAFGGGKGWGTTTTFENLVCESAVSRSGILVDDIEEGIPQAVARDPYAIGYTCLGTTQADIKALPIAEKSGDPLVAPNAENLLNGTYPLERDLYLYVAPDGGGRVPPAVEEFVRFILSKQGQEVVAKSGMIPLSHRVKKQGVELPLNPPMD